MVLGVIGALVVTAAGTLLPIRSLNRRKGKQEEVELHEEDGGDSRGAAPAGPKEYCESPAHPDSANEELSDDGPTSEESSLEDSCPETSDSDATVRGREERDKKLWEGTAFPEDRIVNYGVDSKDEGTPDRWVKRHPELVRLTGRHPFNCEAPLPRLMEHGFLTPVSLHYVRNHGAVPFCDPKQGDQWTVEVGGLVRRPQAFTVGALKCMPSRALPVTLVCAGNRRKEQNMVKQTIGFSWGAAGLSTTVWRGVLLCDVLRACGVRTPKKKGGARKGRPQFVCFEGAETLPGGGGSKYATSISMEVAMDPSCEVMLAYEQNGSPLEPDHGFPIRMIIPGYIGGRMVKWLKLIEVKELESDNYYHYNDNRVLPSHVDADVAKRDGWWYKPDFIINELSINSTITTPSHDHALVIPQGIDSTSTFNFQGYAYSGGGRKIIRVEITLDNGRTWRDCEIIRHEKPTEYGKYWCWVFWNLPVPLIDLRKCREVAVRAWDAAMNTQPQQLTWNVMGMMNNCWFRIKIHKAKVATGSTVVSFEHPTQAGNLPGGWMTRPIEDIKEQPEEQEDDDDGVARSRSGPPPTSSSAVAPAVPFQQSAESSGPKITWEEVKKHDNEVSAWIVVHGKVYDCTPFLKGHPGGAESILINAGTDCTEEFDAIHSSKAKDMLKDYYIGDVVNTEVEPAAPVSEAVVEETRGAGGSTEAGVASCPIALDPKQRLPFPLIQKDILSHDTRRFRFALQSPEHRLGLPVGKHMLVSARVDGKLVMRAYTPSSSDEERGYFDLVVKVYFRNVVPQFPDGGIMSQHLDSLSIGDTVDVKGPIGHVTYHGRGRFVIDGKEKTVKRIAMLAGGTGITPIYQVLQAIMRDAEDKTQVSVVYANRTPSDVLLREDLDAWAAARPHAVHMWYTVSAKSGEDTWPYDVGFVNEEMVRKHLPLYDENTIALMCGPPPMLQHACVPNLHKLGYPDEACISF